jgi:hypothetical protein
MDVESVTPDAIASGAVIMDGGWFDAGWFAATRQSA